ncbi:MAG: MCE family protein [Rhodospirillales bacterium]|nr:MCE family protein [Rhodospirillales bacterium]
MMQKRPTRCWAITLPATFAAVLVLTGCEFTGLNSLPLPGTEGRGDGSYSVRIEMPEANGVLPNTQVRVADVVVGTIDDVHAKDWNAVVTVLLNRDVALPANAVAKMGQTSLLGQKHMELGPPPGEQPVGRLQNGDVIPLSRASAFPRTEEVLSALAFVLNGAGLSQVKTIIGELNRALSGREGPSRELIGRLRTFVGGLEEQKTEIVRAIDGLDRLSGKMADQNKVIARSIEDIRPALKVLNRERADLTKMLAEVGSLGDVITRVINSSGADLVANLRNLEPTLARLADSGKSLTDSMKLAFTVLFPLETFENAGRGDYFNIRVTADLTMDALDRGFLSGTPLEGVLSGLEGALGHFPGMAGEAKDPLRAPLQNAPDGEPSSSAPSSSSGSGGDSGDTTPESPPPDEEDGGLLGPLFGGTR